MPNITFKPSVKQDLAWQYLTDNETNFIGYGGAAYGGKSYLLCNFATIMCMAYPDIAIGVGRKELTTLKRTTLVTLFKVFDEYDIRVDRDYHYNQQLNVITFTNKSQIFLIDTSYKPSDPLYTRMGGYELTHCAIDESAETSEIAIDILFSRCGRRNNQKYNLKAKMLETFNPDKGHIYHRYYKPHKEGRLSPSYKFIKALPSDNPSPEGQEYVKGLMNNASKITIERLVYGNFEYDDDPNALIDFDAITDLWTNPSLENQEKYIVADIARYGSDRIVITVWNGLELTQVHTFTKQGTDITSQAIRNLAFTEKIPFSRIIVDSDGVGGGVADQLRGIKSFTANASPFIPFEEKDKPNYANLKAQCAYLLAEKINKREMSIHLEQCVGEDEVRVKELLIEDLEQVKSRDLDKEGKLKIMTKEEIKDRIGRSPDYGDCLMMRMYFEVAPKGRSMGDKARTYYPKSLIRKK